MTGQNQWIQGHQGYPCLAIDAGPDTVNLVKKRKAYDYFLGIYPFDKTSGNLEMNYYYFCE